MEIALASKYFWRVNKKSFWFLNQRLGYSVKCSFVQAKQFSENHE
jgi:hypothetical protein